MVEGPDPNRHFETDPELAESEEGMESPGSTRLGLPSWLIALVALVIAFGLAWLLL